MTTWRIKPSIGNVLVRPIEQEETTKSGLIITGRTESESHIVEVINVCDPYEADSKASSAVRAGPVHSIGDLVLIGKYNGRDITLRNSDGVSERVIIIRESDVLGTFFQEPANGPVSAAGTDAG